MQTTKRKPKPKKVKDYIPPEGKKIIAKVLNGFSNRRVRLNMRNRFIHNQCGTECCFGGEIAIEKFGAKRVWREQENMAGNIPGLALRALGIRNHVAREIFKSVFFLQNWDYTEEGIYYSGHRTRALRMAVARTMETEV